MKIGIMGGTFDPVHNGHLALAKCACRDYLLDQVWFMPNGHPPHKDNNKIVCTPEQRAQMVSLAIRGHERFRLEDYELKQQKVCCSYETMEHFKKARPDDTFYFIIGADSLFSIEQWVHVERLFPTCTVLAGFRDDKSSRSVMRSRMRLLRGKYQADIRLLTMPPVDVSSHELRRMLMEHADVSAYLPEAVEAYIRENRLYA